MKSAGAAIVPGAPQFCQGQPRVVVEDRLVLRNQCASTWLTNLQATLFEGESRGFETLQAETYLASQPEQRLTQIAGLADYQLVANIIDAVNTGRCRRASEDRLLAELIEVAVS